MNALATHLTKLEETIAAMVAPAATPPMPAPAMIELKQADVVKYITGELKKAKDEKDEAKAKKRLAHLQKNIAMLAKYTWEDTGGAAKIPEYQEPNLTAKTEESMSETQPSSVQQPENSLAANQSEVLGKLLTELQKTVESLAPVAPAAVAATPDPNANFWPSNVNNPEFMKEGVAKRGGGASTDAWGLDPWAAAQK